MIKEITAILSIWSMLFYSLSPDNQSPDWFDVTTRVWSFSADTDTFPTIVCMLAIKGVPYTAGSWIRNHAINSPMISFYPATTAQAPVHSSLHFMCYAI